MILLHVFWPVGSKLLVHPQEAFDAAFLVCRYGITASSTAFLSFPSLYWLSAITLLNLAADCLRVNFVFYSMLSECFFSFWLAEAKTKVNGSMVFESMDKCSL
jgi:hypothetical protein